MPTIPLRSEDQNRNKDPSDENNEHEHEQKQQHPKPTPLLRLKIQDLNHKGATSFLRSSDVATTLQDAVDTVLRLLYPAPSAEPQYQQSPTTTDNNTTPHPPTRSITLTLSPFSGVAYTTGKDLDPTHHKEIHLSTDYIASVAPNLLESEIRGVIVHEMVHCWQWNGNGTAPGGLIEGVADWVRLKAGLAPPHWRKTHADEGDKGDRWDAGYEVTAWFLAWLEDGGAGAGAGTVPRINRLLKDVTEYDEDRFWKVECGFGKTVHQLWDEYCASSSDPTTCHPGEGGGSSREGEKGENKEEKEEEGEKENGAGSDAGNGWTELSKTEI